MAVRIQIPPLLQTTLTWLSAYDVIMFCEYFSALRCWSCWALFTTGLLIICKMINSDIKVIWYLYCQFQLFIIDFVFYTYYMTGFQLRFIFNCLFVALIDQELTLNVFVSVCICLCVRVCCPGLAYCRHLSTVRTHLSALVNHTIVDPDVPCDAYGGLTTDVWQSFLQDCSVRDIHLSLSLSLSLYDSTSVSLSLT